MKRNPITLRGAEMLRAELKRLKSEDRPNIIKAIAEARRANALELPPQRINDDSWVYARIR